MNEESGMSRSEKISTAFAMGLTILMIPEAIALLFTFSDGSYAEWLGTLAAVFAVLGAAGFAVGLIRFALEDGWSLKLRIGALMQRLRSDLSARAQIFYSACALGGWVFGLSAFGGLGGVPIYNATTHQYTLNSHGDVTVVSQADYWHALALQNRLFLGLGLFFTAAAAALALSSKNSLVRLRSR
jgi:hypothetical protein